MRDHDLRASLSAVGQMQPALEWEGQLIDGRRRRAICSELALRLDVHVCLSLQEACSKLWAFGHYARALELAHTEGASRVLELAQLCGTTASAIALEQQRTRPKSAARDLRDAVKKRSTDRMIRRTITFEPELLTLAKTKAKSDKENLAMLVRRAIWKEVRDMPGAPRQRPRRVQPQTGARRRTG
jgi:hypothetical protein